MGPTQTHISLYEPLVVLRQIKIGSHLVGLLLSYAPNVSENRKNEISPIENHLEQNHLVITGHVRFMKIKRARRISDRGKPEHEVMDFIILSKEHLV